MRKAFLVLVALAGATAVLSASVASAGSTSCTGTITGGLVNGNLTVPGNCDLEGTHVTGNVSVTGSGSLTANNAAVDGDVEIQNDSGTNSICGTTIGGNLQVHNNSGTTTVGNPPGCAGNVVGSNLEVHNNSGAVNVASNIIGGNLDCHNDSPAASGNSNNAVGGKAKGECEGFAGSSSVVVTKKCGASGCTAHAQSANGDTSADFTVPGGGDAGLLTIALSSAPTSDGCGDFSGPTDSSLFYNAPTGYGTANPITVGITYAGNVSRICKNSGEGGSFVRLFNCGEENGPPCIASGPNYTYQGESIASTSFMLSVTSNDPIVNGH
jgi:hypothetical protein